MNKKISMKIRSYSWLEMERLCNILADKISDAGFHPDLIVGIIRGGCFPALLLSHRFKTREMYTINVRTTLGDSVRSPRALPEVRSMSGLPSLSTKSVLLVDDVTNTGNTLLAAISSLERLNPGALKTACPVWDTVRTHDKSLGSCCLANYYVDEIEAWAAFPWEKYTE